MSGLNLKNFRKVYPGGKKEAAAVNLEIGEKEFLVFVGPSGCGKSTILRMLAGLEDVSSGEFYLDGKLMNDVDTKDRDIAMIFQNSTLYPQKTVYENMAYGLELRKVPKELIEEKIKVAAEILGITDILSRKPKTLTGLQRQRVGLARAIVREPKLFLFDEPLSNLDAKLRTQMRSELMKLQARLGVTFLYATRDVVEAFSLGTRVAVMRDGRIEQVDTPQNLYDNPVNVYVAEFVAPIELCKDAALSREGTEIFVKFDGGKIALPDTLTSRIGNIEEYLDTGKRITLGIRPEDIHGEDKPEYSAEHFYLFDGEKTILQKKTDI